MAELGPTPKTDDLKEVVRERYAAAATQTAGHDGSCCGGPAVISDDQREVFGSALYSGDDREELPEAAQLASLGCGNPTAVAELNEGETVLDLGSGGGIDVLLSARRVGPSGMAYGLDMTDEMLELARSNQREAGVGNVEFLKGEIERIPLARRLRRRDHLQLRHQPLRRQVAGTSRGGPSAASGRPFRGQRRRRRSRHGRVHQARHASMDRLHRRGPHTRGVRAGPARSRLRLGRDRRDPSGSRPGRVGDRSSAAAGMTDREIQLNDPQALYRNWEESQWSPFTIDLDPDRAQWERDGRRRPRSGLLGPRLV